MGSTWGHSSGHLLGPSRAVFSLSWHPACARRPPNHPCGCNRHFKPWGLGPGWLGDVSADSRGRCPAGRGGQRPLHRPAHVRFLRANHPETPPCADQARLPASSCSQSGGSQRGGVSPQAPFLVCFPSPDNPHPGLVPLTRSSGNFTLASGSALRRAWLRRAASHPEPLRLPMVPPPAVCS